MPQQWPSDRLSWNCKKSRLNRDSMEWATPTLAFYGIGGAALATSVVKLRKRLELSQAKHKSLAGHSRLSRRLAAFVPYYEYDEKRFFCADGAPDDIAARRRIG